MESIQKQESVVETLVYLSKIQSCEQIEDTQLKDELSIMPGSLVLRIFEAWQAGKPTGAKKRSIRYLRTLLSDSHQEIGSLYDKMSGFTGMTDRDVYSLLLVLFQYWGWDHEKNDNTPLNNPCEEFPSLESYIQHLNQLLFEKHNKLLMVKFQGKDIFRFFNDNPEKRHIAIISGAYRSLLYSVGSRGVLKNFPKSMSPYMKRDDEQVKGVHAWAMDFGNTSLGDEDSVRRYKNLWEISGALRSLELYNYRQTDNIYEEASDEEELERKDLVQYALNNRLAVIARGVPKYMSKYLTRLYKDSDGEVEPDKASYSKLVSDFSDLSAQHFIFPPAPYLWSHDALNIFTPPEYNAETIKDELEVVTQILVSPDKNPDSLEMNTEYWCLGNPASRGEKGRQSALEAQKDSFIAVEMDRPSAQHDRAYNLLYFAISHRLGRAVFPPGDPRSQRTLVSGANVIWLLRQMNIEVMSARTFLDILCLSEERCKN